MLYSRTVETGPQWIKGSFNQERLKTAAQYVRFPTSNYSACPSRRLEVVPSHPSIHELAQTVPEVSAHRILVAVEGVVHQLQHGPADHALGDGVGDNALCKK